MQLDWGFFKAQDLVLGEIVPPFCFKKGVHLISLSHKATFQG
jgi:hypothetical protein